MSRSLKLTRVHQGQKFQNHFGQLHIFMAVLLLYDHSQHGNTTLLPGHAQIPQLAHVPSFGILWVNTASSLASIHFRKTTHLTQFPIIFVNCPTAVGRKIPQGPTACFFFLFFSFSWHSHKIHSDFMTEGTETGGKFPHFCWLISMPLIRCDHLPMTWWHSHGLCSYITTSSLVPTNFLFMGTVVRSEQMHHDTQSEGAALKKRLQHLQPWNTQCCPQTGQEPHSSQ